MAIASVPTVQTLSVCWAMIGKNGFFDELPRSHGKMNHRLIRLKLHFTSTTNVEMTCHLLDLITTVLPWSFCSQEYTLLSRVRSDSLSQPESTSNISTCLKRSFNVLVGMQALSHLPTTTWNGINNTTRWTPRKRIRAPITSLPHDIHLFPSIIQTTGGTPQPSFRQSAIRFCFITFRLCYWSCQVKHHEGAHHVPLFYSQQLVAIRKWLTILFAFFWAKCTAINQKKWGQPRCIYLCIFAWPKSSGFTAWIVDILILISSCRPIMRAKYARVDTSLYLRFLRQSLWVSPLLPLPEMSSYIYMRLPEFYAVCLSLFLHCIFGNTM